MVIAYTQPVMIRLNLYCSLIPSARQARPGTSYGSLIIHNHKASEFPHRISIKAKAIKDEMDGETSGSSGRSWDPGLEIEVPFEQRPVGVNCQMITMSVFFR